MAGETESQWRLHKEKHWGNCIRHMRWGPLWAISGGLVCPFKSLRGSEGVAGNSMPSGLMIKRLLPWFLQLDISVVQPTLGCGIPLWLWLWSGLVCRWRVQHIIARQHMISLILYARVYIVVHCVTSLPVDCCMVLSWYYVRTYTQV